MKKYTHSCPCVSDKNLRSKMLTENVLKKEGIFLLLKRAWIPDFRVNHENNFRFIGLMNLEYQV
jgi:hypothetical protein